MQQNRLILFFFLSFSTTLAFSQYKGFDEIDETELKDWDPGNPQDFSGVYHFGDSEAESDLVLFQVGDLLVAQIVAGDFNGDGTAYIRTFQNIENASISDDGEFSSLRHNGELVTYKGEKCLKVYNSWSGIPGEGEYEVGCFSYSIKQFYPGDYPQASTQLLEKDDLMGFTKEQLQIMRNEIFARYGHIFRSGGKMETHFKTKDWYKPEHQSALPFLTPLEDRNIDLIKSLEK